MKANLKSLKGFTISGNKIVELNSGPLELPELEELDISHHQLVEFPASILKGCYHLRWLDLSNNKISNLPASLSGLPNLESITLAENPIPSSEIEVFQANHPSVKVEL